MKIQLLIVLLSHLSDALNEMSLEVADPKLKEGLVELSRTRIKFVNLR